ncbi:glycosyltransferase family 4 protein [Botryobacter ruber]|uniref:glycosyltransferase family 4 protein n=1 Tax=Botryobacter ruber TaxID=2171629 RepID=UPI000E0A8BC7|nr:glycosyltransferase family 4 protein [Botryobacter ruber]
MSVLFVVPYPPGEAASQRFRFEQYLPLLHRQGIPYRFSAFWSLSAWKILYQKGQGIRKALGLLKGFAGRVLLLPQLFRYTHVFIHREATPLGPPWFEWLAAKVFRKKIIYDFDDAIWLASTSGESSLATRFKWHRKVAGICSWSYKVSCGNSYLQAFALRYNPAATVLPTTIDTVHLHNRLKVHKPGKVTIGWTGTHSTLPYLQLIEPVLLQLEQQFEFDFIVIADKQPRLQLKSWRYLPWRKETEVEDLLQLDIGLMPLPDTAWAKGKCAFKALQYMALGIPAVVSGVGANVAAVPHEVAGYLCYATADWYTYLERLILHPELRATLGAQGRAHVQQHYSVMANEAAFLDLFK